MVKKWKGIIFLLAGLSIGVLLGLLVYTNGAQATGASAANRVLPPVVGSAAPAFQLPLLSGGSRGLSDLKGKPVLINFWATWCLPCKDEMPLLNRYAQKYQTQLTVIGIDSSEDAALVKPYIDTMGIQFPILLDSNGAVTDRYFVRNFPITFFVDADGILRAQHLGELTEDLLVRYLETIGIKA